MPEIHFDALPRGTTRSTIIRLIVQVGGMDRGKIGSVRVHDRKATAEVPSRWAGRLATLLDGVSLGHQNIRCWTELQAQSDEENIFRKQIRLLELEGKAEAEQALQSIARLSPKDAERTGNSLCRLVIREKTAGLGGRAILSLGPKDKDVRLPWTRLDTGSPVLLSPQAGGAGIRGVVCRRTPTEIEAAFDRWPNDDFSGPFRLDISNDEVSRQRQRRALERAETAEGDRLAEMRQVLVGEAEPRFDKVVPLQPASERLNPSQTDAVAFAMAARDVAIIHGPPGTGKTTTVVELIRQAVRAEQKVLACAPSNLGVDNLVERLIAADEKVIRIGHPARVLPQLRERTLDLMLQSHPDMQLVKKLHQEARKLFDKADRFTRAKPAPGAKRALREEAKEIRDDARRIERQIVQSILDNCDVLCATLTSLDSELLGQRRFDLAVIDEAGQAVEPGCWIPLLRSERVVLAGDYCQLPPTVLSQEATDEGFSISMLERLVKRFGSQITKRLDTQYRMNEAIMSFSSEQFYDGELKADASVRDHSLADLEALSSNEWTRGAVCFIDTAGWSADEELEPDGDSRRNPGEVELVEKVVRGLMDSKLNAAEIAVITPYAAQVRLIRERFRDVLDLEIDSVDGFQGREKEAVVVSLVRSNPRNEIGFLRDTRRMNVAWTRARRKLIVIGDSATIGAHPFYQAMLEHMEKNDGYRSVWEMVE